MSAKSKEKWLDSDHPVFGQSDLGFGHDFVLTGLADAAAAAAAAGNGSGGGGPGAGQGGGGGSGGGGGNGGGKPDGETAGNNLSFPAIFFGDVDEMTTGSYHFAVPTTLSTQPDYTYFAQGVVGNTWSADYLDVMTPAVDNPYAIDYVDIGDALESSPLQLGRNVRLELSLYETLSDYLVPEETTLTAFEMTLLGGAKGSGKPSVKGPTESQGARVPGNPELPMEGSIDDLTSAGDNANSFSTYESEFASIYAAAGGGTEGETADSYMSLSIQKVTGVSTVGDLAGLSWVDGVWTGDGVDPNLFAGAFGPELNIAGKYIMGMSGKPFKFTDAGSYLITFALEDGAPISFDDGTLVQNDSDPLTSGFQPGDLAEGRETWVIPDGDTHNGLLVMLVGVPSEVGGDEGGDA